MKIIFAHKYLRRVACASVRTSLLILDVTDKFSGGRSVHEIFYAAHILCGWRKNQEAFGAYVLNVGKILAVVDIFEISLQLVV